MSPPFMPFYVGDYLSATQHLGGDEHGAYFLLIMHCWQGYAVPEDDAARARIVRFPIKRWLTMRDTVMAFFEPDGTHRRVTMELSKATAKSTVRAVVGSIGGLRAAAKRQQTASKPPPKRQQTLSKTTATLVANGLQNPSKAQALQNHIQKESTSSEQEAARARSEEMPKDQQDNTAGELATALRGGALTRPPDAEQAAQESKPPSEVTRAELEATFERRRARDAEVAAERTRRVWGRSQPPPLSVEKQEGTTDVER